jgi:PIN domain nuclease of toxin-antitoxin system
VKLLLDTHALLSWCADDPRLSAAARAAIGHSEHEVLVSAASAWEIATKARLGKLAGVERLLSDFAALMAADHFTLLPMSHAHALLAGSFAQAHRDPFDRMLAAQALIEDAQLVTNDAALDAFGVRCVW